MAGKLQRFMSVTGQHFKGLTLENHIGGLFQSQPQLATENFIQILALREGNKAVSQLVQSLPTKEFDTKDEYYWNVIGSNNRNIALVECRRETGDVVVSATEDNVGEGTMPFYLVFGEDWFAKGDVIVGHLNEYYQFRIIDEPRNEGLNTVYKVELMSGAKTGVPAERVLPGEKFSVEFSPVEDELSRKVGDITFTTPTSMRNEWSHLRLGHKVAGTEGNKKLVCNVAIPEIEGNKIKTKVVSKWMQYVDYEFKKQFLQRKDRGYLFGRSNRDDNGEYHNFGDSGNVIKMGAGLYEQMEYGNWMQYNEFSLKLLEDALYAISSATIPFAKRKFVLKTGEYGAIQFNKAVKETVSGWYATGLSVNADQLGMVKKVNSELHDNALGAGYQFTEYYGPNGLVLKLEVDPYYDDVVRNKIKHHNGGPAMSYRYDIIDLGSDEEPNIMKCAVKSLPDAFGYQWGFRNPFTGANTNMNMSYDEDSCSIHQDTWFGVLVYDPTRTFSLVPSELVG